MQNELVNVIEERVGEASPVDRILRSRRGSSTDHVAPALESAALAALIDLVREGGPTTRPELVSRSGLSRKIVTQRIEQAIELGLIEEGGLAPSGGGRQARTLHFRAAAGHVFAAQIGASEMYVGIADLSGRLIDTSHEDWPVERGPEETMERLQFHFAALARRSAASRPWGVGIGVPGPVDFATGRLVAPPIMPGWNGFSVRSWMRDHYDAPVWVDNDVNLMALGEFTSGLDAQRRDMLYIKVGTGVGAGLVSGGRLVRGERGGAGDIGHMHITNDPSKRCRCGKTGCLEAVAGGWSLLIEANERASESPVLEAAIGARGGLVLGDIAAAVAEADPLALDLVETRARAVGEVAANLVNFTNPGVLVVGGGVLRVGDPFLRAFSDAVMAGITDLAAERLTIRSASLNHLEGVTGAALLAAENLMAPATLTRWVEAGSPLGRAAEIQRYAAAFH